MFFLSKETITINLVLLLLINKLIIEVIISYNITTYIINYNYILTVLYS